jgi:hypothetical protein
MKLCIEGVIYFIPKFHILETGTVKLSIEDWPNFTIRSSIIWFMAVELKRVLTEG